VGAPHAPPDSVWKYSNTNYVLLGLIAQKAGGQSYAKLLRASVLEPLRLQATFVAGEDSITAPRAHAFLDINGDGRVDDLSALVPDPAMTRGAGGAGAGVATAADVARFARAYYSGTLLGEALHGQATRWRDRGDGWRYGFGLIANPKGDDLLLGHLGNTAGQSAGVWHSTRLGITAVILTNAHGVRMADAVEALLRESSAPERRP
jgi:D-alanyl-D-alanine carboxypeptidase